MSCNAYGHPPACECGWGGVNHDPWRPNISPDWSRPSSHTIPNARCPVCQSKVFFYRSPDGGAVFFDELGPPWSKHPCTAKNLTRHLSGSTQEVLKSLLPKNVGAKKNRRKSKRVTPQWWPYPCGTVETLPNNEGICLHGEGGKRLFVQTRAKNVSAHTPIWIRTALDMKGKYEVSTFKLKNGNPVMASYVGYSAKGIQTPSMQDKFEVTRKEILGEAEVVTPPVQTDL